MECAITSLGDVIGSSVRLSQRFAVSVGLALVVILLGTAPATASDKFAYLADGIYIADQDGSNPVHVTTDTEDFSPALSPDARTVAFNDRDGDLWLVDADGRNERLLFDDPDGQSSDVVFSPDTNQVVFERIPVGSFWPDLYRIGLDGQNLTRLTSGEYVESDPAFSADGNLIAFSSSNTFSGYNQLVTMKPDGSDQQPVTPDTGFYYDQEPAFSPDAEQIVFSRMTDEPYSAEIWKVDVDEQNLTQLTTTPGEFASSSAPTWSPDGSQIVYYREDVEGGERCCELWAMDPDGTNQHKIVDLGFTPTFQQPDAMEVSGDMFDDIYLDFDLDPAGNYEVTVSARDSVFGVSRYELLVDSSDGEGYTVKDSVDLDCSSGCPQQGPEETLALNSAYVPNDESDIKVRAIDGASNAASRSRNVAKRKQFGIAEMRLDDAEDPNPFPIYTDPRLAVLKPKYFRLFVYWDRLEPSRNQLDWNADIGGGPLTDKMTVDDQINQIKAISPDVEIVVTFWQTPCWAVIPKALKDAMPEGENECTQRDGGFPNNNPWSWPDPYPDGRSYRGTTEYKQFVRQFAARYSDPESPNYKGIKYYTAWNEPNYFKQAQPQRCKQGKTGDDDFETIKPCPGGETRHGTTADDYYMKLYDRLYDAINVNSIYGKPGKHFPGSVQVLAGETADIWKDRDGYARSSDEAVFTRDVIQHMLDEDPPPCGNSPWAKHGYGDLDSHTYDRVQRLRRVLDGKDPDTGEPDPELPTSNCTKGKQIWMTEMAARYFVGDPDTPDADPVQQCRLHDFLAATDIASTTDRRRTDVYVQYLYQTSPDSDSGLLRRVDVNDDTPQGGPDGKLDKRQTYHVFKDWSLYSRKEHSKPQRPDYNDTDRMDPEYINCTGFWGS